MTLFTITLSNRLGEFSVLSIANVVNNTAKFQGICNGAVFCESKDYEAVRAKVLEAVQINQEWVNALQ
jgi:hypothetical protein